MTDTTPPIIETDAAGIAAVLVRLSYLKAQVKATREMLKPLEEGLEQAKREYQDHMGALLRQRRKVEAEIAELADQIRTLVEPNEKLDEPGMPSRDDRESQNLGSSALSPTPTTPKEAISSVDQEKDLLLEHAYRLLDPMVNSIDADLIGELQGLVNNRSVTLADILEWLPWGMVWEQQSPVTENLAAQYRRLSSWERALVNQLAALKRGEERLQQDGRYPLWQRRQQGTAAWQIYLAEAERQLQDEIKSLELRRADRQAELRRLMPAR